METEIKIKIMGAVSGEAKQLQLLDSQLAPIESVWVTVGNWNVSVPKGIYTARLNLPTGERYDQAVSTLRRKKVRLVFDLRSESRAKRRASNRSLKGKQSTERTRPEDVNSPEERLLLEIFGDSLPKKATDFNIRKYSGSIANPYGATIWIRQQRWSSKFMPQIDLSGIDRNGKTFTFITPPGYQVLELDQDNGEKQYVALPPSQKLKCLIRLSEDPTRGGKGFDVSIKASNTRAQALLSLINSGDMSRARSLYAISAEQLLYEKMEDPVGAAIGGYYLLKVQELQRLHNWANNLAERFTWLPDGCVIHAWQMILQNATDKDRDYTQRIRQRLLEALSRGMPLYTEGLRLLYEGLLMCSYHFGSEDRQMLEALLKVKNFIAQSDMSKETTTYIGEYPELPVRGPSGLPSIPTPESQGPVAVVSGGASYSPEWLKQL